MKWKNMKNYAFLPIALALFFVASYAQAETLPGSIDGLRYENGCGGFHNDMKNGWSCGEILPPYMFKYTASSTETVTGFEISAYEYDGSGVTWRFDIFISGGSTSTPIASTGNLNSGYPSAHVQNYGIATTTLTAGQALYFAPVKVAGGTSTFLVSLSSAIGTLGYAPGYEPGNSTSTGSVTFPKDSILEYQHDFTDWAISATNGYDSTVNYKFKLFYGTSILSLDTVDETALQYIFASDSTHAIKIKKNLPLATSTTYYAKVCGYTSNGTIQDFCSETIAFKTGINTAIVDTSQLQHFYATGIFSTSTEIEECETPGGFTDIGGGISYGFCKVGKFLFTPSEYSTGRMFNAFEKFKTVFPFGYIFAITDALQAQIADSETGTTNSTLTLSVPGLGFSADVLSSTTLSDFTGNDFKNWFFTLQKWLAWVAVLFTMIAIIKIK